MYLLLPHSKWQVPRWYGGAAAVLGDLVGFLKEELLD
jgi:hypothetical protein